MSFKLPYDKIQQSWPFKMGQLFYVNKIDCTQYMMITAKIEMSGSSQHKKIGVTGYSRKHLKWIIVPKDAWLPLKFVQFFKCQNKTTKSELVFVSISWIYC